MRDSKRRTSSSRTKIAPAIGALNAVARPAPAPAARSTLQSGQLQPNSFPIRGAMGAPLGTLGPSRPSASPAPIASTPPTNFTGMMRDGGSGSSPLNTASTWGVPLPDAYGEYRRTSQAATSVAAAEATTPIKKPARRSPCPQAINVSRRRSAFSSASRKTAPTNPAAAPTISAKSASARRLPEPSALPGGTFCLPLIWLSQIRGDPLQNGGDQSGGRRALSSDGICGRRQRFNLKPETT